MSHKTSDKVEKYISFKDHGLFYPMMDPYEIINYGAHEGAILTPELGFGDKLTTLVKAKILEKCNPKRYMELPSKLNNHFHVMEASAPSAVLVDGEAITSDVWYAWYSSFYEKARNPDLDKVMIKWWATVVDWGTNHLDNKLGSPEVDQMLLHYAWDPYFRFKGNLNHYI